MSVSFRTESRKTYASSSQFRRMTDIVSLNILCMQLYSGGRRSCHLGSDVMMIKSSECPKAEEIEFLPLEIRLLLW